MAWSDISRIVSECDVVIEVIDARFPLETRSKRLEEFVKGSGKRLIVVVNKCDLVTRRDCEVTKNELGKEGLTVVLFSTRKRWGSRILRNALRFIGNELGLEQVKAGIVGYANVGKSSVASLLKGRASARSSPRPGFTRGVQWVRVSRRIMLLDTPGIIPRQEGDVRLALKGAYDVTKLEDPELAALELIKTIPSRLLEVHYGVKAGDPEAVLENLARKWNMLRKGGTLDLDRAAKKLLLDWQKGKILPRKQQ